MTRRSGLWRLLALLVVLALVAASCGDGDEDSGPASSPPEPPPAEAPPAAETEPPPPAEPAPPPPAEPAPPPPAAEAEPETLRIVFFAGGSQNAYNQAIWTGVQKAAEEDGNVEVEILDGEFNPELQFNQVEDVVASGRFDGYVIAPNDPVGIVPAIEEALAVGPVATALFPIGPDLETLEPQLDGIITAAGLVTEQAEAAGVAAAEYCASIDPCRVVLLMGFLTAPFDQLRLESFREPLDVHDNIEIVAIAEGFYARDPSLTAMQDLLQANPEFEVLLSVGDQQMAGAIIALEDAGIDIVPMWLSGGGASQAAADGIRAGTWDASTTNFPVSEGYLAARNVIAELRGEPVEQVNDVNAVNDIGGAVLLTAEVLEAYPDWVPEWAG